MRDPHLFWFSSHVIREPYGASRRGASLPSPPQHDHEFTTGEPTMYDMYPDWGPASHDPENPRSHEAVQAVA